MRWLELRRIKKLAKAENIIPVKCIDDFKYITFEIFLPTGIIGISEALEIYERRSEHNPQILGFEKLISGLKDCKAKHIKIYIFECKFISYCIFTNSKCDIILGCLEIPNEDAR
jgi:hypothetical protein